MKKIIMRTAAIVMAAAMMLSLLAGCRNDNNDDFEMPEFVFVPEIITLPEELTDIRNLVYAGDKLYFTTYVTVDEETFAQETRIFSMNLDGTNMTELSGYVSNSPMPDALGNVYISALRVDHAGNLWVLEQGWFYRLNIPDDFEGEEYETWEFYEDLGSTNTVRKLDSNGAEVLSVDIGDLSGGSEYFWISVFNIDNDGNIYLGVQADSDNSVIVLNSEGRQQFKLDITNWIEQLIRMPDGSIAFFGYMDMGYALRRIDFEQRAWGATVELPPTAHRVFPGAGDYDMVFLDSNNLFGLESSTGEVVKILNLIDSDVMNDGLENIVLLPDGRIMCTNQRWTQASREAIFELILLTKTPYADLPERTILTLSALWLDWNMRTAIVQFNRTSTTHRIQVFDYSEFNTEDDWNAGLTRLSAEIISGRVPDILAVSNLPFKQYVARDVLLDLYPLIDSDPVFNRGDFMESVFQTVEMNGGLYQIFPSFTINSVIGHPSVVGPGIGWNVDEFMSVLSANPQADMPMGRWLTNESFLQTSVMFGMDEYVDWANGKVHFDTGGFAQLLELANTFPSEIDYGDMGYMHDEFEMISTGRQIMVQTHVSDLQWLQMYRSMFGGDIVFKGFPTENRNGNGMYIGAGLAITTRCKDVDGAWSFMRTFLEKEWQLENTWGFPTNKAAFDSRVDDALAEQDGSHSMGWNGFTMEQTALTQAEVDQVMDLIHSVSGTISWNEDQNLMNIIMEGAQDFFGGRATSQDAARVVQNRASIYISEQS